LIQNEVNVDYYDGSHDDSDASFVQILHGCKKPQVLLLSFKYVKQNKHGYDNEVTIDKIAFTNSSFINNDNNHEEDDKENQQKGEEKHSSKHRINFDEPGSMNIMNMNIKESNSNAPHLSRVDFDKFSVITAESSAQLIDDITAFLKSSLFYNTSGNNDNKVDSMSEVPPNFKVLKFKVYFVIDMEKCDRIFLHHFHDVHVTGNPHWPSSSLPMQEVKIELSRDVDQ